MPNYVHLLPRYADVAPFNTLIGNSKCFMAYQVIKELK